MPRPAASFTRTSILMLALIIAVPAAAVPRSDPAAVFAPDHLMVRLDRDAYARSALPAIEEQGKAVDPATGLAELDATIRELGVTGIARALPLCDDRALGADFGLDRCFRFDVPVGTDIEALAARLTSEADVDLAYPDRAARLAYVPSDPRLRRPLGS